MTAAPDVFLSYNREDQAVAKRFAEGFESAGLSVWWDVTLRSGEAYDQVTEEALRTAKAVVVLWSARSVVSRWVRAEATLAERNHTLVPARIGPCDLPIMFELTQTADLSGWQGGVADPAWQAFLADVRRMVAAKAAPVVPGTAPSGSDRPAGNGRPMLAILPFLNRSGFAEDEGFAEELVEELTASLSASPWMGVATASATAGFNSRARDPRQIGRELGARYLLEGGVRRIGSTLRVTAQLTAADESNILCTKKFDRPLAELALAADELAMEIRAIIGDQIQRSETERALRMAGGGTSWEAFMRAVSYYSRGTLAGYKAAIAEARRLLESDPDYAFAFAILLSAQSMLVIYDGTDCETAREMVDTVRRARAADPDSAGVLSGCAAAFASLRRPLDALPFAERGVAIFPDLDWTRAVLGLTLVQLGREAEALSELDIAERLAPNTPSNHHDIAIRSVAYLQAGRIAEATEAAERAVRLLVSPGPLFQSTLCQALSNDRDRARDTMRRLRDTDPALSLQQIENLVRYFHCGSSRAEEYVGIVRGLWDAAQGEMS